MPERFPRYSGLEIHYIREVPTAHVAEVTDDLAQDFMGIHLHRETFRVAAGGIGVTEAAVLFLVATAASGFLTELGKDTYGTTRAALWRLYRKLRRFDTESGRFQPLSVATGKSGAGIYFIFEENLTKEEFIAALTAMAEAAQNEADIPDSEDIVFPWWVEFRFDTETRAWEKTHKEIGGAVHE